MACVPLFGEMPGLQYVTHCRRHCIFAAPNSLSWRRRGAVARLAPAVEGRHT